MHLSPSHNCEYVIREIVYLGIKIKDNMGS